MNKDNENKSNSNENVDENKSSESVDLGDYSQLMADDGFVNNSDCSNNESIGGGDSPNTFVQSEEKPVEELTTNVEEQLVTLNTDSNTLTDLGEDDSLDDESVVPDSRLSVHQTKSKLGKSRIIIIIALLLVISSIFILVKKPFVKNDSIQSSITLDSKEEKEMKSILDRILSYYDSESTDNKLKKDIKIDYDELEKLEEDINKVKNEDTKSEFIRLYRQLQEDIINQSANTSSIENLSSDSIVFRIIENIKI